MQKFALKSVINVFTTILVVIVVIFAVVLMGVRLVGFDVFNVISGSMEPEYSVGDLIYVKHIDVNDIKVNDVITFVKNDRGDIATHRVIKVDKESQHFYTKGDANDVPDAEPVHFKNYIGKPVFSIPLLGYVSNYIQNPPGMYVAIGLGVVLVILVLLPDSLFKKSRPAAVNANTGDFNYKDEQQSQISAQNSEPSNKE